MVSHENITERKVLEIELARFAATDTLTGLPNRRYFLEFASKEVARSKRFGTPAAVIIMDLDHFKAVNDTFGHVAGDNVLRRVSEACSTILRQGYVLARFGGEEFVALIPGSSLADALIVAERLRGCVLETIVPNGNDSISLTASIGVTEIIAGDEDIEAAPRRHGTLRGQARGTQLREERGTVISMKTTLARGGPGLDLVQANTILRSNARSQQ